tara:strand:- start:1799 stop:1993 length:195 start_codon:yes stop_codon:yes gene_type:complete
MILLFILAALLMLETGFYLGLLIRKELKVRKDELQFEERMEEQVYPSPGVLAWMKRQDIQSEQH